MRDILGAARLAGAVLSLFAFASGALAAQPAATPEKQKMKELGLKYDTAWALYEALKKEAGGGQPLNWRTIPDWSGPYTRTRLGTFDPDDNPQAELYTLDAAMPTAKFTPEYRRRMLQDIADRKRGIEYDPLSQCVPPGYPRWFEMPFMREHIITPQQTVIVAEAFNSVRFIYTDGRGHIPVEDRYPTENGDSIGFWDGDRLIVHTNQLMAAQYGRGQGFYSDQVEGVEIWRKVDDRTIEVDLWLYDPPALLEPWYTKQKYSKLADPDKNLRLRHWACKGNPNNDVHETPEGGSQFGEFTFTPKKDAPKQETRPAPGKK